jgi:GTPase SAR1 family protein
MSARSTSNESSSTSLQSPRNKKSKPPTSASASSSSSSSSSSSHTVQIIYNYQNYPQSEAEKEEKKVVGGYDLHLKLLMLGDSGVGKSSLVLQYANEEFTTNFVTTIGIDYKIKLLESGKHKVKLQIWDTVSV